MVSNHDSQTELWRALPLQFLIRPRRSFIDFLRKASWLSDVLFLLTHWRILMKRINPLYSFPILGILLLSATFTFNAYGYDLFGSDIASLPALNANACEIACNANSNCLAWTWVKAGLKGPDAVCFLKNPIPVPSFNSVCKTNYDCLSGVKRSDRWCGESPNRGVQGNQNVLGQGAVLTCLPPSSSCGPKVSTTCTGWWIFKRCSNTQTVDFFCQP